MGIENLSIRVFEIQLSHYSQHWLFKSLLNLKPKSQQLVIFIVICWNYALSKLDEIEQKRKYYFQQDIASHSLQNQSVCSSNNGFCERWMEEGSSCLATSKHRLFPLECFFWELWENPRCNPHSVESIIPEVLSCVWEDVDLCLDVCQTNNQVHKKFKIKCK